MRTAVITGAAAGGFALAAWAVRGRSSQVFGPSIWRGPGNRRALALTFDDGPSESTPELLALLARHHARATFFQCGANVERLPERAREVAAAGHEIGNHSHSHARMWLRAPAFIYDEFARAQATIAGATGRIPRLLRAPYGVRWPGFGDMQRRLELLGVMWTVIGRDWRLGPRAVAERVTAAARPGAIICLHDGRELQPRPDVSRMLAAVAELLPRLRDAGYSFETVGGLIGI
ncbi:MAG: polysaccharide deacetylase family protein [Acidobacteria bacterium]|nr:polysaccharide deacetylase family protein [Acidobacteriota bacterium]